MTEYVFTFHSLTQAQTGLHVLCRRGIPAQLKRAPGSVSKRGCSYALAVGESAVRAASAALFGASVGYSGVYRWEGHGEPEEVIL